MHRYGLRAGGDVTVGIRRRPMHEGVAENEQYRCVAGNAHGEDIACSGGADPYRAEDTSRFGNHIGRKVQCRSRGINHRHVHRGAAGIAGAIGGRNGHRRGAQRINTRWRNTGRDRTAGIGSRRLGGHIIGSAAGAGGLKCHVRTGIHRRGRRILHGYRGIRCHNMAVTVIHAQGDLRSPQREGGLHIHAGCLHAAVP